MPMTAKRKKRFTYIAIGGLFFLSAIEYAVILPTVWLYIKQRFGAKLYLMGLVLSAFSFAGLLASPIMGKWSDHSKDTKSVLLVANLFEIGGSIMYFLGISGWFLVASRFVAGVGSGIISPLFADISRITTVKERTAVMSSFMAVRQFGLLVGPGFNLILRELHFYIGPYIVDKYTSPGVFMACVWTVYEVYIVFFYTNLPQLKIELEVEKQQVERDSNDSPFVSEIYSHEGATVATQSEDVTVHVTPDVGPDVTNDREIRVRTFAENDMSGFTSSDDLIESAEKFIQERQISKTSVNTSSSKTSFPRPSDGDADSEDSGGILFNVAPSMSGVEQSPDPCHLQRVPSYGSVNNVAPSTECLCRCTNIPSTVDHSRCSRIYGEVTGSDNEVQCLHTGHQTGWTWSYYYNEHMREEVVVVLSVVFVAFFNQMALESMVTPLTAKLLHWGELENSLMYCTAGAEILLVFLLVRFLSRHISDRNLLVAGFVFITISTALLMWFLTNVHNASRTVTLTFFVSVITLDLFGLPFLLVTSISLYSKITRAETQGFSQGVRRIVASIGMIMGPLWVSGLWDHLYVMFGVILGMNALVMVMMFVSYQRLVAMEPENEACSPTTERQPLLQNT